MSLPLASTIVAAGVNTRDKFDTGSAGVLSVVGISWPAGTDVDAVLAGTATPDTVHLSSDGRHYVAEWHTGAESAESVYVERWSPAGREFHGFVDAKSRKIVQAG